MVPAKVAYLCSYYGYSDDNSGMASDCQAATGVAREKIVRGLPDFPLDSYRFLDDFPGVGQPPGVLLPLVAVTMSIRLSGWGARLGSSV